MARKSPFRGVTAPQAKKERGRRLLGFESLEGRRVLAENLAPVNVVPGDQTYTFNDPTIVFSSVNQNQISTADPDVGSQTLRMTLYVTEGSLTLSTTTGLTFLRGNNGSRYLLFDGTQAAINTALEGLRFQGNPNRASDVLTVDTHDLGHTGTGGAKVDRDTILLVRGTANTTENDPPVNQVPPSQTFTTEQPTVTFGTANRIRTSDPDAGNNLVRVTLFVNSGTLTLGSTSNLFFQNGTNGSRYLLFDGTITNVNNALLGMTYVANPGASADVLTIDVHDLGNTGTGGPRTDRDQVSLLRVNSAENLAPVNSTPAGQFFGSAGTVLFDSSNQIFVQDPDAGSRPLRVTLFVNGGTLTLGTTSGLSFRGGGNGTKYLLFDGSQNAINNALFNLLYRANAGTNNDVLTIDTHDLGNTGFGGAKVDRDTVTLTRVSGFARGAGGGSGESTSPASSASTAANPPPPSSAPADEVFASRQFSATPTSGDSAARFANLLASTNSGRSNASNSADRLFGSF